VGQDVPTTFEAETERVSRREERIRRVPIEDTRPRPSPERIVNGVLFEVVWDGS